MFHELPLVAREGNGRLFAIRRQDPPFVALQQKIFERDQYTCQFCGFRTQLYLEVVNVDGDFKRNQSNNLATACPLCTQCFFLEEVGKTDQTGGVLIDAPEISQGQLNALCHTLFLSMISNGVCAGEARTLYRSLKGRNSRVEKILGEGLSSPARYGRLLIEANSEGARRLHETICANVRLLPDFMNFAARVVAWMEEGVKTIMVLT
ncbi:MAG: hypothetical protein A3J38_02050 [Gammaproteobacteria bacterium RIFCSPHIGHO2_12_FULL_45_9]|nr:MAG: hypothetical protein A3J38_02050 [Gammaproteobacteria bacterium RIFCSPHIGHO2_12_FULL_45_9]